jgi:2-iminobutanoate/2-iminopropanoate deaminase
VELNPGECPLFRTVATRNAFQQFAVSCDSVSVAKSFLQALHQTSLFDYNPPSNLATQSNYYRKSQMESVQTDRAPQAIGPYSQAIKANGFIFASGQIPLDPATGQLIEGDARAQTARVLNNVQAVLEAAGSSLNQVVKTTVFLADMNDFAAMNEVYASFFGTTRPARSTVQAARLPRDVSVEIEVVALA